MNQNNLLTETLIAVTKDFDIQPLDFELLHLDENALLNEIKKNLTDKIKTFLDNNIEKLLTILYRIDIQEDTIKKIFSEYNKNEIPLVIADIIIERQLDKIKTRQLYRNRNTD
ncbi:MAG: hypothetical protein ACRDFC_08330 [Ignavibacteria bacterium]